MRKTQRCLAFCPSLGVAFFRARRRLLALLFSEKELSKNCPDTFRGHPSTGLSIRGTSISIRSQVQAERETPGPVSTNHLSLFSRDPSLHGARSRLICPQGPGDVILWDSRLVHQGGAPASADGSRAKSAGGRRVRGCFGRMVQYVCCLGCTAPRAATQAFFLQITFQQSHFVCFSMHSFFEHAFCL